MEHFKRIANGIDVSHAVEDIRRHPELWRQITDRQNYAGSSHKDTETIFLRWCAGQSLVAAFTEIPAIDYPALGFLPKVFLLVYEALKLVKADRPERIGRVIIARLKPGGFITPHIDEGAYADHYERFHVSLESDGGNAFMAGDPSTGCGEFVHMRPGELWWFNHKTSHWVANGSDTPRTHLIIDAVAPKYRRERAP